MKEVIAFELKDLPKETQDKVIERATSDFIDFDLQILSDQLEKKLISEEEFYTSIGCSKSYAESTSWFVPSCYYQKNKAEVDAEVVEQLKDHLFDDQGNIVNLLVAEK
jgi:hypothetical protein